MLVCFADVRREVDHVAELDDLLDGLAASGDPILVELAGGSAVLSVGIGRQDAAVVLFRDADGAPWCARSNNGWSMGTGADLEFAKNGTPYRFFDHAAVTPAAMQEAARAFVRSPGVRPSALTWVSEGAAPDARDGGQHGS